MKNIKLASRETREHTIIEIRDLKIGQDFLQARVVDFMVNKRRFLDSRRGPTTYVTPETSIVGTIRGNGDYIFCGSRGIGGTTNYRPNAGQTSLACGATFRRRARGRCPVR